MQLPGEQGADEHVAGREAGQPGHRRPAERGSGDGGAAQPGGGRVPPGVRARLDQPHVRIPSVVNCELFVPLLPASRMDAVITRRSLYIVETLAHNVYDQVPPQGVAARQVDALHAGHARRRRVQGAQ